MRREKEAEGAAKELSIFWCCAAAGDVLGWVWFTMLFFVGQERRKEINKCLFSPYLCLFFIFPELFILFIFIITLEDDNFVPFFKDCNFYLKTTSNFSPTYYYIIFSFITFI